MAERLKAAEPRGYNVWAKKAEALSLLGDDQGVLDLYATFQQRAVEERGIPDPLLPHLVAVALLRLGREQEARQQWQDALRLQPGDSLAQENLEDLRKPIGERHAPWPFALNHWLSDGALKTLALISSTLKTLDRKGTSPGK
jgi:hypothetical protein